MILLHCIQFSFSISWFQDRDLGGPSTLVGPFIPLMLPAIMALIYVCKWRHAFIEDRCHEFYVVLSRYVNNEPVRRDFSPLMDLSTSWHGRGLEQAPHERRSNNNWTQTSDRLDGVVPHFFNGELFYTSINTYNLLYVDVYVKTPFSNLGFTSTLKMPYIFSQN